MPHLDIQYTANLEADADMTGLCRTLTATLVGLRNDAGEPVFPLTGTRVMAWPAAHYAVGLTLEVDEGAHIYEGKQNNLANYMKG